MMAANDIRELKPLEDPEKILESISDGFFALDEELRVTYFNRAAEEQLHKSRQEVLGKYLFDAFPEARGSVIEENYRTAVRERKAINFETWFAPFDEWYEVRISPNPTGIYVYFLVITARKRAEQSLQESEAALRTVFDAMHDGVLLHDSGGAVIDFNRRFLEMYGVSPGEAARLSIADFSAPTMPIGPLHDSWQKVVQGEEQVFDWQARRPSDGSTFPVEVFLRRVHLNGRDLVLGVIRDLTERKLAEERTSELLGQLRAIFDHIPLGIAYLDADFRFLSVNRFFCELVSLAEEELLGQPCYETIGEYASDDSRQRLKKICRFCKKEECIQTRSPTVIERPLDDRVLRVQTVPEINEELGITRFLEIVEDITARKRLEESLREGERRFREMIETLPQLVWTADTNGGRDFLSRQWLDYTGMASKEKLGEQWLNFVHPEDRARTWELWNRFLRGEGAYDLEHRLRRADGEYRWFKTRGVPIRDEHGNIMKIFGTSTDIDHKIRAEESLRKLGEQLQRSNQELEQFAYVVSHDLREPLRTISGFLGLVRKRCTGVDPEAEEFIHYAVDGANRLDRMIHDLLEYSRIQRQKTDLQPLALTDILRQVTEDLRLLIEDRAVGITHEVLPMVRGDGGQLYRLLQNLISNAITYCRDRKPEIRLRAASQDAQWRISVQDNGIGIEPAHQDRIFQIFQRLHTQQEYPGTGIGLAICKKIVERHGGRIWVESEPGKGSTFYFTLPKA
jgi:PAS domain S-box-containing protein